MKNNFKNIYDILVLDTVYETDGIISLLSKYLKSIDFKYNQHNYFGYDESDEVRER